MKRFGLLAHLKARGCQLEREGARHIEIDNRLVVRICRQLGIDPPR